MLCWLTSSQLAVYMLASAGGSGVVCAAHRLLVGAQLQPVCSQLHVNVQLQKVQQGAYSSQRDSLRLARTVRG
jgi:hypothetical protein